MSSVKYKKSSNQIDQAASLFGIDTDPKAYAIDPAAIRIVGGLLKGATTAIGSGTQSFFSGEFVTEAEELVEESIANLLPKLEDITIKSLGLDYTTNPVSVKLVLQIKNSTGYPVVGISGRVPNK